MKNKRIIIKILISISEIVLSVLSFVLITKYDPIKVSETQSLASLPAFFVTIIIILIGNTINTVLETDRSNSNYEKIHSDVENHHKIMSDTVKNHMDVIPIGSPEVAFCYIFDNIKEISAIGNTSFTLDDEVDVADIMLYNTNIYNQISLEIAKFVNGGGVWRDIGDEHAKSRFNSFENNILSVFPLKVSNYRYKLIIQPISQINFILLNYKDGTREVLFNWDFKAAGQNPIVLLSRNSQIVSMFSSHFEYLWRAASIDHDSVATKSTSEQ